MKTILTVSLIVFALENIHAEEELFTTCPELKGSKFESLSNILSQTKPYNGSKFYFGLKNDNSNDGLMEINDKSLSTLENVGFRVKDIFDFTLKTYVIIHGYRSNCRMPWVLEMKDKILKTENVNVILVDWSDGSYAWNYIDAVRTTTKVSKDLVQLLLDIKSKIPESTIASSAWNNLYIIGHSLGAHISGQTGHLLKSAYDFFRVERITGLDPARPCFLKADSNIKLDSTDADFVDVIHTQTSLGDKIFGFGLQEPVGHLDFYVNGGVMQPACKSDTVLINELDNMFCSHGMAYQYFIASMDETKSCQFEGHSWDQTYYTAIDIFKQMKNKEACIGCVTMGRHASNKNSGVYLVLTSAEAPYCSLEETDFEAVEEKLELLKSTKEEKSLFNILFNTHRKRHRIVNLQN